MKAGTGHSSPRWGHMVLGASSMELLNLRVARHGWPGGTQILGGFVSFFFLVFSVSNKEDRFSLTLPCCTVAAT